MRRRLRWAAALPLLMVSLASQGADVHGSLGASSDNIFRGRSLSRGEPSLIGDLHVLGLHWFGGVAVDTVRIERGDAAEAQVVGDLGYQQPLPGGDWIATAAVRHYDYPGDAHRVRYDYDEFSAELSWRGRLAVTLIGSPDAYAAAGRYRHGRGSAVAVELTGELPLPRGFAAQAGLGYQDLRQQVGASYAYWNVGAAWRRNVWALAVSYIGTDATARRIFGSAAGDRVVASVAWFF